MGGPAATLPDADFAVEFERWGGTQLAERLDMTVRAVMAHRKRVEDRIGRTLVAPDANRGTPRPRIDPHPDRLHIEVPNGIVVIGGDAHYWPGRASLMHRAFCAFIKELRPKAVIMNGDAFDGATISRHPPIGWENRPTVAMELEACQERLCEIELATPRSVPLFWPIGNHDERFERRLAQVLPELARVKGVHLKDHFGARWQPCLSTWINNDVVSLHSFRGGKHATYNNTLHAGKSVVTNHLHSGNVRPVTDYNGTRYGVDTGMLAALSGKQFAYAGDIPKDWREGFAVLPFKDGRLMMPELVTKWDDDSVQFRGEVIAV